jgi:nicotinamide-nucleotide amidase
MIRDHGAVSAPVAQAMAVGCRTRLRTDLAVSTTGLAGPGGPTDDKPIGLMFELIMGSKAGGFWMVCVAELHYAVVS